MVMLEAVADEDFAYVTTTGRRTGRPHEIEIWFGLRDGVVYLLSGGGACADWVRNLLADPRVRLRIGSLEMPARARVVEDADEDAMARRLLAAKYQGWSEGQPLTDWASTALPVAIEAEPGSEQE
jgi:deazaflavin-dependent oxidoreductase (nitroreductase family)